MTKKILIDGDVIVEHHIFQGTRSFPDSTEKLGTQIRTCKGGASLLFELCRGFYSGDLDPAVPPPIEMLTRNTGDMADFPPHRRAYAVWGPCKKTAKVKEDEQKVWRVTEMLGYGSKGEDAEKKSKKSENVSEVADIVVLDDAALDYRFDRTVWPSCLNTKTGKKPEWIVVKMSHPLCHGDLWQKLREKFSDKLILIASANDLRRGEVMISRSRSWEQTVQDLMAELQTNAELTELHKCRHLIIHFQSEGALWIDNANNSFRRLIFDAGNLEGEWGKDIPGQVLGRNSCFTAGVVRALLEHLTDAKKNISSKLDLARGIGNGLAAMRTLQETGFGAVGGKGAPGFPVAVLVEKLKTKEDNGFSTVLIAEATPDDTKPWTLIDGNRTVENLPLYGFARQVAQHGPKVLKGIPYGRFGALFTVDRRELESLNGIQQLIDDYVRFDKGSKPLSIGVFGPPGAGKSFGIKQIAKGILGDKVSILEFNLSQFSDKNMLDMFIGALHQVRDKVLQGTTPVVFWDEFDSGELKWLQYLLAPMQDGAFLEGQMTHPIGKCIFVFAGGTRYTMKSFSPENNPEKCKEFKLKKGPDFVSRLRGSLNVLGPNPRQVFVPETDSYDPDATDTCFPIRRALLLRVLSGVYKDKEELKIDSGLLNAFMKVREYKHGARSMETIVSLTMGKKGGLMRSNLPPREQMDLHVDYDEFVRLIRQDMQFKATCKALTPVLAKRIHEFYLKLAKKNKWEVKYDMSFDKLPAEIKNDNVAAAVRIPKILSLAGLQVVLQGRDGRKKDAQLLVKIRAHIEHHIELLAEAEHNGWLDYKISNDWKYGEPRDDSKKIHNCLKNYAVLNEKDKEKDRDAVRNYPDIAAEAGYTIIFEKETC